MNATFLTQAVPYVFSNKNKTGTISTTVQIPKSAIILSTRTVCLSTVTFTGTPVINVGTSFSANLFLNALTASTLSGAGVSTPVDGQTRIMDDTLNVLINISGGNITGGSFITFINYYYPTQNLPNVPYIPIVPPTPSGPMILKKSLSFDIPADSAVLTEVQLFNVSGQVNIKKIVILNTDITSVGVIDNITNQLRETDGIGGLGQTMSGTMNGFQNFPIGWTVYFSGAATIPKSNEDISSNAGTTPLANFFISQASTGDTFVSFVMNNATLNIVNYTGTFDAYIEWEPVTDGSIIV